ncbi:MAG: hypothetical protein QOD33_361 [Pyrinomonadaceae bacterium]|jgi:hypothetical protein|nr:hypothetical protein [Pyrinomonadaceae bacterium]
MTGLQKRTRPGLVIAVALVGFTFLAACTNRKIAQVGTHKVTVSRHGFEKRLIIDDKAAVPTLEYAGVATDGKGLKVFIKGDVVTINGVDHGQLRAGDAVLISDEGVAVNSLDYGESEKYMRANGAVTNATASK